MDRGLLYDSDTMCIEDEKVYFWNPRLEDYQANYVTHTCTNAYLDLLDYDIGRTVHLAANASSGRFIGAFIYVHDESDVYIHIIDTWGNVFEVIGPRNWSCITV